MSKRDKKKQKQSNRLDFYKNRDETHPYNLLYEPPCENFYGPIDSDSRQCTDWGCIPGLIVFIIFSAVYAYLAYNQSDLNRIFVGNDFRADMCGFNQLSNRPYQYFLNPNQWGEVSICVSQCPNSPDYTQQICLYSNNGSQELIDYCYLSYYTDEYKKYCMPKALGPMRKQIESIITTDFNLAKEIGGDFLINIGVIIGAFVMQITLGVVFVLILLGKRTAHIMLWFFVFGFCVTIVFITQFIDLEKQRAINKDCPGPIVDLITGVIITPAPDPYLCIPQHLYFLDFVRYSLLCYAPIYVVIMIASFHQILRMIQVMDHMIKPLRQLPHMLIIPFVVSILQGGLAILYMLVYIGGVSAGVPTTLSSAQDFPPQQYRSIVFQVWQQRGFYALTFLYIWLLQAMYYFVRLAIATCCSVWYYSRDKNYLNSPVSRSLYYALRYHAGSYLMGSLLLIATWMFSGMFYFWLLALKAQKRTSSVLQVLLVISIPLFWVYEYLGKYCSNRNYMHMAVYGDNFWTSGNKMYYIRTRNQSRIDLTRSTLGYVRVIGMSFISTLGAYIVYFSLYKQQIISQNYIKTGCLQVEYPIVPTIFVFITGLYISQNFSSIIDIVAEVMIFDLVADEEMFMGKQRFADQDMLDFANKYSKETEKKEFVVSNKGKVNPMNDNANEDDVIKPINVKDLVGAEDSDDGKDKDDNSDDDKDDDDSEARRRALKGDSDDDEGANKRFGINLDDLNDREKGDEDENDYEDDEVKRANARRKAKDGRYKDIQEDDVKQMDLNYKGINKDKKANRFQF